MTESDDIKRIIKEIAAVVSYLDLMGQKRNFTEETVAFMLMALPVASQDIILTFALLRHLLSRDLNLNYVFERLDYIIKHSEYRELLKERLEEINEDFKRTKNENK